MYNFFFALPFFMNLWSMVFKTAELSSHLPLPAMRIEVSICVMISVLLLTTAITFHLSCDSFKRRKLKLFLPLLFLVICGKTSRRPIDISNQFYHLQFSFFSRRSLSFLRHSFSTFLMKTANYRINFIESYNSLDKISVVRVVVQTHTRIEALCEIWLSGAPSDPRTAQKKKFIS